MKKKKGFTLIELLAVIAIMAILVIIAVPTVLELFKEAKINTFKTQAQQIFKAAEQQYMSDSITGTAPTGYCQDGDETTGTLDLSGSSLVQYEIVFQGDTIIDFSIKDGNYSLEITSPTGVTIDEIKNATLDPSSELTIGCGD